MACGTPAIVYNATACPELIGKNCGYIVEKGDVQDVLKAINKMQQKGKSAYSSYCREFTKKNFEKDTLIEEMKKVYFQLLEGQEQ